MTFTSQRDSAFEGWGSAPVAHEPLSGHRGDAGEGDLGDRVVEGAARPALAHQLLEDVRLMLAQPGGHLGEAARVVLHPIVNPVVVQVVVGDRGALRAGPRSEPA